MSIFRNRSHVPPRSAGTFGSFSGRRRTSANSNAGKEPRLFISAKTPAPFTVRSRVLLDLAIQRSLDPEVRTLRYVSTLPLFGEDVAIDLMVADCENGSLVLDIVDDRPARDVDADGLLLLSIAENGLDLVELSTDDVLAEPFASNNRQVWRNRFVKPSTAMFASIEETLRRMGRVSIGELSTKIGFSGDLSPFVYAMACADQIEIDLSSELDRRTTVALRRPRHGAINDSRSQ